MIWVSKGLALLVVLAHLYFFWLESFAWRKVAAKTFRMSQENVEATATMASNQGAYNGLVAIGLLIGVFHPDPSINFAFRAYFLFFVIVAGIWGAATVNRRIFYVQALPALLALGAALIGG